MRENMNTNKGIDRKLSGGGHKLNDNSYEDSEVEISNLEGLFYDVPTLSEEEQKEIDKMIKEVEDKGFKDKFFALAEETERKRKNILKIGSLHISKAACMIVIICLSTVLLGVTVYAAILNHIKSIEVKDLDTHSEIEVIYNNDVDTVIMSHISDYKCPAWVPEDYYVDSEFKTDGSYSMVYKSKKDNDRLNYCQYLPSVNAHYSTEEGTKEKIMLGEYTGEFIETEDGNYLIVTDGTYLYSLIGNVDYEAMKKIISSIRDFE